MTSGSLLPWSATSSPSWISLWLLFPYGRTSNFDGSGSEDCDKFTLLFLCDDFSFWLSKNRFTSFSAWNILYYTSICCNSSGNVARLGWIISFDMACMLLRCWLSGRWLGFFIEGLPGFLWTSRTMRSSPRSWYYYILRSLCLSLEMDCQLCHVS